MASSSKKTAPPVYNDDGDEITMTAENVEIVRKGTQIILPEGMSFDEAGEWIKRKRKEEETIVAIYHDLEAFPLDGAYAFSKAIEKIYGWSSTKAVMVTMSISPTQTVQVPWGKVEVPGIEGELQTGLDTSGSIPKFVIQGRVKAKHRPEIMKIYELTKKILREQSVYRHKAIRVDFSYMTKREGFNPLNDEPKFMDVSSANPNDLIFESETKRIIRLCLFSLIEKSQLMRDHKVPLKKGILLAGPYGTGKTMTANVTAKLANDNGWTFIYVKYAQHLHHALRMAQQYSPAVIFAEDIDRAVSGDRTTEMDEILNTLDGVDTKHSEIITVLTTNHLDQINPAMLRPGRLDSIVPINLPDADAAAQLIRIYGRGLLSPTFDYVEAGNALRGKIPAVIRECVERAKAAAIDRVNGDITGKVEADDVIVAAAAMNAQIELIKVPDVDNRSPLEKFGAAMGAEVANGIREASSIGEAESVLENT